MNKPVPRDPRLDRDLAELETLVVEVQAPLEMAARSLGFVDLQACMQAQGFWWWPQTG